MRSEGRLPIINVVADSLYGWRAYLQDPARPCTWHGWIVATEGDLAILETEDTGLEVGSSCRLIIAKRGMTEDHEVVVVGISGRHAVLRTSVCKVLPAGSQDGRRIDDVIAARVLLDGNFVPLEVTDLSSRGLGFMSVVPLPESDEVEFELFLPDRVVGAKGVVAHQRADGARLWRGGCRLVFSSRLDQLAWNKHLEEPLRRKPVKSERLAAPHPFPAADDAA